MADPRYEIPGPVVPDLSPGLAMLTSVFNQRRADKRAQDYLDMEREAMRANQARQSAEDKRKEDAEKRKQAIEAWASMPALMRAAHKSIGYANQNPYGVKFEEGYDLPAGAEGPEPSPAAEAARFSPQAPQEQARPAAPMAEVSPAPEGTLPRGVEGPIETPEAQAYQDAFRRGPDDTADLMDQATTGQPLDLLTQAASKTFPQTGGDTRRVFANYGGQRFEVPEQNETTGLGEEYDRMFQSLLDAGEKDHDALKAVTAQYKADRTQQAIADRAAQSIDARRGMQGERFDFQREMGLNREDKLSEAEKNRQTRLSAARIGASNPLKVDTANRQDMGTLRQGFKEWKNTVNLAIDSKSHKRLATAMSNLDSGNAMQQREAAESLVSIFKGGGQVTKASQDLLLHNLAGIVGDAQTWIQKKLSGQYGDAELGVLKQATQNALAEEKEKLHAYYDSAADTFGPGSGYEQLGGNVNALIKGAFKQFGYDAPDLYQGAESVVLGSGKRPSTAKPHPQMVTIRNKKTGETKQVTREEALKIGAIQ